MACFFFGGPAAFLFRLMLLLLLLIMYHEDIKREPGKNIVNYKNCIIERFSMLSLRYRGAFFALFYGRSQYRELYGGFASQTITISRNDKQQEWLNISFHITKTRTDDDDCRGKCCCLTMFPFFTPVRHCLVHKFDEILIKFFFPALASSRPG